MYVPDHFCIADDDSAYEVIERHPFATLVSQGSGGLDAAHIPFLLNRTKRTLQGHVARANPIWQSIESAAALVIFQGPNAYISPDWYADNQSVPTWNYQAVHVTGRARLLPDNALDSMLAGLSEQQEQILLPKPVWRIDKLDDTKRAQMRRAIVGFEIVIDRIKGKAKLSQNKSEADRMLVIEALRMRSGDGNAAVADLMNSSLS